MLKKVILIGVCIGASASVPILYQANPDAVDQLVRGNAASAPPAQIMSVSPAEPKPAPPSGRSVVLEAGSSGHFIGTFRINGRKVEAMIDTGASAVAINLSTARRLGIGLRTADLTSTVSTANGMARATGATIDRIEIGRVSIENVPAIVLEDRSLGTTLIGMTFLNRLKTYKVENGRLVLNQ